MREIKKRIEKIEKNLGIGKEVINNVICLCYVYRDENGNSIEVGPSEPIEQNPQYIAQMREPAYNGYRSIVIYPDEHCPTEGNKWQNSQHDNPLHNL